MYNSLPQNYSRLKSVGVFRGYPLLQVIILAIQGNFYEVDLTVVDVSDTDKLFFIEKVIKKKTINGQLHYLVKWEGYPTKMNSYVLASEIKTLK